jgi:hypothetical protein
MPGVGGATSSSVVSWEATASEGPGIDGGRDQLDWEEVRTRGFAGGIYGRDHARCELAITECTY